MTLNILFNVHSLHLKDFFQIQMWIVLEATVDIIVTQVHLLLTTSQIDLSLNWIVYLSIQIM